MPDSLPPSEQRKLVGILGRLGSDHSGEVVAAAYLASTMLRRHGLTWEALLAPAPLAPTGEPDDWRTLVATCLLFSGLMTEWERKFLGDVRLSRRPTPRQIEKVQQIAAQLRERRAP